MRPRHRALWAGALSSLVGNWVRYTPSPGTQLPAVGRVTLSLRAGRGDTTCRGMGGHGGVPRIVAVGAGTPDGGGGGGGGGGSRVEGNSCRAGWCIHVLAWAYVWRIGPVTGPVTIPAVPHRLAAGRLIRQAGHVDSAHAPGAALLSPSSVGRRGAVMTMTPRYLMGPPQMARGAHQASAAPPSRSIGRRQWTHVAFLCLASSESATAAAADVDGFLLSTGPGMASNIHRERAAPLTDVCRKPAFRRDSLPECAGLPREPERRPRFYHRLHTRRFGSHHGVHRRRRWGAAGRGDDARDMSLRDKLSAPQYTRPIIRQ